MRSVEQLELPCRFGKYELLERIGLGGMAAVYRARLPGIAGFEKIVVVKRMHPQLLKEGLMVQMFVEEAKLAAEIIHPNVVQVYELDRTEDGELFIVMEYIHGTDLRRLLRTAAARGQRLPPWFSVYVMTRLLDGLAHVHELVDPSGRPRNVVHRDLAPDNVFVSVLGEIKLGDFGVAKDDARGPEPHPEQLKGKFSYMAPELFLGQPPDQRCDVYSAGVVLWECLAQRALFRGANTAETVQLVCRARRPRPSELADDVPAELDDVVLAAIDVDPDHRTPSARALQASLLQILPRLRTNVGSFAVREVLATLAAHPPREHDAPAPPPPRPVSIVEEVSEELIIDVASVIEEISVTTPVVRSNVHPIPMPGAPSSVETSDIVARKRRSERFRQTLRSSAELWAPYDGPHPFWVRATGRPELGPMGLAEVMEILRSNAGDGVQKNIEVSADGHRWLALERLRRLALLDLLVEPLEPPRPGALLAGERSRPAELVARLDARAWTGRVRVWAEAPAPRLTEIHLVRGEPTYVATSEPAHELVEQLVRAELLGVSAVEATMHEVVRLALPLEEVLSARAEIDLAARWPELMAARLVPAMRLPEVSWALAPDRPLRRRPFAASLVELLLAHGA